MKIHPGNGFLMWFHWKPGSYLIKNFGEAGIVERRASRMRPHGVFRTAFSAGWHLKKSKMAKRCASSRRIFPHLRIPSNVTQCGKWFEILNFDCSPFYCPPFQICMRTFLSSDFDFDFVCPIFPNLPTTLDWLNSYLFSRGLTRVGGVVDKGGVLDNWKKCFGSECFQKYLELDSSLDSFSFFNELGEMLRLMSVGSALYCGSRAYSPGLFNLCGSIGIASKFPRHVGSRSCIEQLGRRQFAYDVSTIKATEIRLKKVEKVRSIGNDCRRLMI